MLTLGGGAPFVNAVAAVGKEDIMNGAILGEPPVAQAPSTTPASPPTASLPKAEVVSSKKSSIPASIAEASIAGGEP